MSEHKIKKWCNCTWAGGYLLVMGIINTIIAILISMDRIFSEEKGREFELYAKLPLAVLAFLIFVVLSWNESGDEKADKKGKLLIQIWGIFLILGQTLYIISTYFYDIIMTMSETELKKSYSNWEEIYVEYYNDSHVLKYFMMFTLIMLAMLITAIVIRKIWVMLAMLATCYLFYYSVMELSMSTVVIEGKSVGIVWCSVLFQVIQTVGFLLLGVYLLIRAHIDKKRFRREYDYCTD